MLNLIWGLKKLELNLLSRFGAMCLIECWHSAIGIEPNVEVKGTILKVQLEVSQKGRYLHPSAQD